MSDERIDIEIQDKVSPTVAKSLQAIADGARTAYTAVEKLKAQLAAIDVSAVTKLANAQARLNDSNNRGVTAQAQYAAAMQRTEQAALKTALAEQKLATEAARTNLVNEQAAKLAAQTALAEQQKANAIARSAASTATATAATNASNAAQRIANQLSAESGRLSRQRIQQLTNLTYQLNDIVVGLASGQRPLTVLLQQGSQISTIFGYGNGVAGTLKKLGGLLATIFAPLLPLIALLAAAAAGFKVLEASINRTAKTQVTFTDTVVGTFQTIADGISDLFKPLGDSLGPSFKAAMDYIIQAGHDAVNVLVQSFKTAATLIGAAFTYIYVQVGNVFKALPALAKDTIAIAANGILDAIQYLINGVVEGLNEVIKLANDTAKAVGSSDIFKPLADVDLSGYKMQVTGAWQEIRAINLQTAQDVGKDALAEIDKILNTDFASKYADQISKNAQARAKARQDANKKVGGGRGATYESEVSKIKDEIAELKLYGDARMVVKAQLDIERAAHIKLTEAQKLEVESLVKTRELLKDMDAVYKEVNGPLNDYKDKIAALNELLKQGLIGQEKYNAAVGQLGLVRDLRDVKKDSLNANTRESAEIEEARQNEAQKLAVLKDALDAKRILEDEYAQLTLEAKQKLEDDILAIETERYRTQLSDAEDAFGIMADTAKEFAGEQSGIYKGLFAAQKAFALAGAIVDTYTAVSKALASSPPPANYVFAAIAAAKGAAQVAAIAGSVIKLKDGGLVRGPGSSRSDSIPARLSDGEFVMNAAATSRNRPLLEAMNDNKSITVGNSSTPRTIATASKLNVVIQNYGTSKQFDVEQLSENDVRIIARDEAKKTVKKDAPKVVANDISNPNGTVSKAMTANTKIERKR